MFYDIDDKAAHNTISHTSGTVPDIENANTDLANDASDLGGRLMYSPETSGTLGGDVSQGFESAGEALVSMINNNIQSASDAVTSYVDGDRQVCTEADAGLQRAYVSDMPGIR